MRIYYLAGAMDPGGAERQLTELAIGMAERGHSITVGCYHPRSYFDDVLEKAGIPIHRITASSRLEKILKVRQWIKEGNPDIMHAVMKRASSIAILANLPGRHCRIIANDLSTATYSKWQFVLWGALILYMLSDAVVTQTEMNRRNMIMLAPWLVKKIRVMRNGVDIERFAPRSSLCSDKFRFLTVARVTKIKNPIKIIEALHLLKKSTDIPFKLVWAGSYKSDSDDSLVAEYINSQELIKEYGLEDTITFCGVIPDIERLYNNTDSLLHASTQEGIPNAVVEAMTSGLPVVAGRISDLPLYVKDGINGYICNPHSPRDIARSMFKMMQSSTEELRDMGRNSRRIAVENFSLKKFVDNYENLYKEILTHRRK